MTKLLSIWFKLFLTTLDIVHIHLKLAFQRLKFYIEENWIIGDKPPKSKPSSKTSSKISHKVSSVRKKEFSKEDIDYPYCETP
jgi:hypothetical protein